MMAPTVRLDSQRQALEIPCESCRAVNRVSLGRLRDRPVCGKCRQVLSAWRPLEVSDATFDGLVGASALPVLVDFWAPWCGPCKAVAPQLEQVAREARGRVRVAKLNTDENPIISGRYGIRAIPSLLLFQRGQEVSRHAGALSAPQILSMLPA